MDAMELFYRTAQPICVLLPSSARDAEAAEQQDGPPADALLAGELLDEPAVLDAAAGAQAELPAAALVGALRVQDEAELSVQVLDELAARDAKVEARAGLPAVVLADVPRERDEAELSVSVPGEPAALDAAELWAWTPAGELARLGAAERDAFPDEPLALDEPLAPDDSLALEPVRDVVPCSYSQESADALLAAGIVAAPAGFRERA
jgi:hypothetical protein